MPALCLPNENLWRIGCVIGSTMGSAKSINDTFETMLPDKDLSRLNSTMFFQCMSHTAAVNVAQYLGLNGTIMAPAAACASALHAIGTGYDLIRLGRQDVLLCGGAEELHPTVTGSFDILFATSTKYNDRPQQTPRPFDRDRDGLVCGEGSGLVVLEDYDRAIKRNARIYAEIIGYSTTANGLHVSQSNRESMVSCMQQALEEAGAKPASIDYVNAHATATLQGDQEEAEAIREVFGATVPVSSLKGYIGHTLGASGAIELAASLVDDGAGRDLPDAEPGERQPRVRRDPACHAAAQKTGADRTEERLRLRRHQRSAGVYEEQAPINKHQITNKFQLPKRQAPNSLEIAFWNLDIIWDL